MHACAHAHSHACTLTHTVKDAHSSAHMHTSAYGHIKTRAHKIADMHTPTSNGPCHAVRFLATRVPKVGIRNRELKHT